MQALVDKNNTGVDSCHLPCTDMTGGRLSTEDQTNKLFIIDVALRVLLASQQLLHLLISQLLSQVCHEVSEFSRRDVAVAILIKMTESLNEVICCINRALAGDGLHDWQEHFKADPLIWTVLVRQFLHVGLSGVLAQCPQHLPNLGHLDLAITLLVKDAEGLLELCEGKSLLLSVLKTFQMM